jgi:hypothetical protein
LSVSRKDESSSKKDTKEPVLPELTKQAFMDLGKLAYSETNSGLLSVFELMYKRLGPYMKYMRSPKQVVSGYHRPVCVKCHCEMRPETNGVGVLDLATIEKEGWEPQFMDYELFDSDVWKCPKCGIEVAGGFGYNSLSAYFQEGFKEMVAKYEKDGKLIRNEG